MLTYKEYILSEAGNLPIFTFTGVNYGKPGSVRNHFGDLNGSPKSTKQWYEPDFLVSDENEYVETTDVKGLLIKYRNYCLANKIDAIDIDFNRPEDIDPTTYGYIKNIMNENMERNNDQIQPKDGEQLSYESLVKLDMEQLQSLKDEMQLRLKQRGSSRPVMHAKSNLDNKLNEREYLYLIMDVIEEKTIAKANESNIPNVSNERVITKFNKWNSLKK